MIKKERREHFIIDKSGLERTRAKEIICSQIAITRDSHIVCRGVRVCGVGGRSE